MNIKDITWTNENNIKTTHVDNFIQFLTAIDSASEKLNELCKKEIANFNRQHSINYPDNKIETHRNSIWFRGHSSIKYELIPSLLRKANNINTQHISDYLSFLPNDFEYIEQFKENALLLSDNTMPYNASKIDWLALGQHYGLKTRLLDFTTNPLVALSFATDYPIRGDSAVIYVFDALAYTIHYFSSFIIEAKTVPNIIPTTSINNHTKYLESLFSGINTDTTNLPIPIITLPYNKRLVAQSGTFLMWRNMYSMESMQDSLRFLYRITINCDEKLDANFGQYLNQYGFTASHLYADLSHAADKINPTTDILFNNTPIAKLTHSRFKKA
ncbi:FRG domain-containing protein [Bifidobacterium miconisargentati]|uniref:FRG domain-containing protein n=1 Tax=Bifidobacterium miconisargentati TaxID=2834437 RepID=UPI001BDCEDF3|nr:FRG domain-containing protein [Bifidobacterium miconisargentati]MBW3090931.1 FRG domain-containing protein [Bifidobacterium miconisargentati]